MARFILLFVSIVVVFAAILGSKMGWQNSDQVPLETGERAGSEATATTPIAHPTPTSIFNPTVPDTFPVTKNKELESGPHLANTPTSTPTKGMSSMFPVHADEGYYKDEPTPERIFRGILKETGREIVNYSYYREFYLIQDSGEVLSVQYQDSPDKIMGSLLNRRVEIRGKYVKLDQTAGGRTELWVGYITPLNPLQ